MADIRVKLSTSNTSLDLLTFTCLDDCERKVVGGLTNKRSRSICSMQDLTAIKKCKQHAEEKKNRAQFLASVAIAKFKHISASSMKKDTGKRSCSLSPYSSHSISLHNFRSPSASSAPNSPGSLVASM